MNRETIEKALSGRPFRPLAVRLADGELVHVGEEHRAAIHPDVDAIIIFESRGGYRILDIPMITEVQTVPSKA